MIPECIIFMVKLVAFTVLLFLFLIVVEFGIGLIICVGHGIFDTINEPDEGEMKDADRYD